MTLTKPDFTTSSPNKYSSTVTEPAWWLWLRCKELEPKSELGGFYANKSGFHNTGQHNKSSWPSNYSIRDKINQSGPGWTKSSAFDWTFPDAQKGNYATIDKYTSRLVHSSLDQSDPRLDLILFEFYGQADTDKQVEGYNEYREENVTSDSSHLWHIHISFIRTRVGEYWGMWALLTVLMGWSVAQWRASLPENAGQPPVITPPKPPTAGIPSVRNGSRNLWFNIKTGTPKPQLRGTDVVFVQKWIGPSKMGAADGIAGPKFDAGVKWYQKMRGLGADGIVGPKTWAAMGVK